MVQAIILQLMLVALGMHCVHAGTCCVLLKLRAVSGAGMPLDKPPDPSQIGFCGLLPCSPG